GRREMERNLNDFFEEASTGLHASLPVLLSYSCRNHLVVKREYVTRVIEARGEFDQLEDRLSLRSIQAVDVVDKNDDALPAFGKERLNPCPKLCKRDRRECFTEPLRGIARLDLDRATDSDGSDG